MDILVLLLYVHAPSEDNTEEYQDEYYTNLIEKFAKIYPICY